MGLILTGTSVGGLAEAACASNHITASLVGLPPEAISRPFFYSAEPESGSTDALFTIRVFGDDCSQPTIGVDYATGGGTAQPGTDYTIPAGRSWPSRFMSKLSKRFRFRSNRMTHSSRSLNRRTSCSATQAERG
jgi:hypothetical protein